MHLPYLVSGAQKSRYRRFFGGVLGVVVSHPSFSIFTIYSGDLEFFRVEKSYLSRFIHHMVNFLIPVESHNAGQKSHVPVKIWWVILGEFLGTIILQ